MLKGLKKLLGGRSSDDGGDEADEGGGVARKPRWEKKAGQKVKWNRPAPAVNLLGGATGGHREQARPETPPAEAACPTCRQPLLAEWGTNCPRCKPRIAVARTMALTAANLTIDAGMALGWLVVLKSPDPDKRGSLIELTEPVTVLSRGARPPSPGVRCYSFEDEFMSSGHASVRRPAAAARDAAFQIEDRRDPAGPSANGVFVNSRRITPDRPHELSDGDIIRLGTTELQFKSLWLPPGIVGQ